ncbi:PLP-dependent aminotransferase family protein, partial [Escherichia coli]|nr:PLP-dependent aminotransferase family protein [Escherichia coli]
RAVDPVWITRQSLEARPDSLRPGCGWLPPDWLPEAQLRRALRQVARQSAAVMFYDTPQGHAPLRQQLALRLTERGIRAHPDQLVLT